MPTEVYFEPSRTSRMELFSQKSTIIEVPQGSKYASVLPVYNKDIRRTAFMNVTLAIIHLVLMQKTNIPYPLIRARVRIRG